MRSTMMLGLLGVALVAGGCGGPELGSSADPIYYGTRDPQTVSLTSGEMLAIGWLHQAGYPSYQFCSGTIIAPRVVATAEHCVSSSERPTGVQFSIGTFPSSPRATFSLSAIHTHSSRDAALLVLDEDATARVPELTPIAFNRTSPYTLVGNYLDAAGYGQTHDGSTGRYFARVLLEQVTSEFCQVDGRGVTGICYGDSGGPLLADGPRVLAVESSGSDSCVGEDWMTRLDLLATWIDGIESAEPPPSSACGGVGSIGICQGQTAKWCEDGAVQEQKCRRDGLFCGYKRSLGGYRCIVQGSDDDVRPPEDPTDPGEDPVDPDTTPIPTDDPGCPSCASSSTGSWGLLLPGLVLLGRRRRR